MSVRRTTVFLAAAAGAIVLALSGCGSSAADKATSGSNAGPGPAVAPAQDNAAAGAGGDFPADAGKEQGGAEQKVPDNLSTTDRAIIYSGSMTVEVKDVNVAAAQAIAFATGAGGFIGGDNRQIDGQSSTATLTLRVPADKFQSTLDQLKNLGDEENRQLTAQDVTDQVVDVESRIATAQASVDRIRALLARAQTIGEITSLESELSRRESDLESLQARKRKLDGLTALSTITLVLHGPDAPTVSEEDTGILVGLRNGWNAFVASLRVALTVLGWLLPWALFLGLPIWLLVWLLRRYRRPRPAPLPVPAAVAAQLAPPVQRPAPVPAAAAAQPVPPVQRPAPQDAPKEAPLEDEPAKPQER
ncbi:DUF4349 domain-containing protein [Dactylosporangium sp. CS-047395]|uniref:DUF4349 domain-containing protein n=1 Tax=Dactylosporangium sp. CS-047395 TaxID=3239936 RepID=UPI003D8FED0B